MKSLILKDIINMKEQGKVYLLIVAIWLIIGISQKNATFFGGVMAMLTVLMPISAFAYDEKAKWDRYALTMPVSRTDMVLSKYILTLLCALFGGIISEVVSVLLTKNVSESLMLTMAFMSIGVVFASIILPIIFKLGGEKGRIVMMAVVFVPMIVSMVLNKLDVGMPSEKVIESLIKFSPLIALFIAAISFFISKSIYERKDF